MPNPRIAVLPLLAALLLVPALAVFLDAATYDDLFSQLGTLPALLLITVRWCDHCVALKPDVKVLAAAARRSSDVLVAHVDADEEPAVATKLGVRAYPTILYVPPDHKLTDGADGVLEFTDYRFAELMAEFVNNETRREVINVRPREAFLRWRRRHPYNTGKRERILQEDKRGKEEASGHVLKERTATREPERLSGDSFDRTVFMNAGMRFMVLLYQTDDHFLQDVLIQWRQANSALTGADNITIALVNLSDKGSEQLVERFDIKDTPRCLYFAKCESEDELPACKEPMLCDEDLDEAENILQYLSDRILEEMGVSRKQIKLARKGRTYHLTEEQYLKMKGEGEVFANDPDQEETIHHIYKKANAGSNDDVADERDEL